MVPSRWLCTLLSSTVGNSPVFVQSPPILAFPLFNDLFVLLQSPRGLVIDKIFNQLAVLIWSFFWCNSKVSIKTFDPCVMFARMRVCGVGSVEKARACILVYSWMCLFPALLITLDDLPAGVCHVVGRFRPPSPIIILEGDHVWACFDGHLESEAFLYHNMTFDRIFIACQVALLPDMLHSFIVKTLYSDIVRFP